MLRISSHFDVSFSLDKLRVWWFIGRCGILGVLSRSCMTNTSSPVTHGNSVFSLYSCLNSWLSSLSSNDRLWLWCLLSELRVRSFLGRLGITFAESRSTISFTGSPLVEISCSFSFLAGSNCGLIIRGLDFLSEIHLWFSLEEVAVLEAALDPVEEITNELSFMLFVNTFE